MATKAVHPEMVLKLTTAEFLAALRRFVARRGCLETLATDNGTNFIGALRELKRLYQFLNSSETQSSVDRFCTTENVKWTLIPTQSPHFGGLWEVAVRSMKLLLYKVVGSHCLSMDKLFTLLVEVKSVLNSHPLVPLDSSSPEDGVEVLIPGHFLIGKAFLERYRFTRVLTSYDDGIFANDWQSISGSVGSKNMFYTYNASINGVVHSAKCNLETWSSSKIQIFLVDLGLLHEL